MPNPQAIVACETLKRVAEVSDNVRVLLCSVVIEKVGQRDWAFTFYQTPRIIASTGNPIVNGLVLQECSGTDIREDFKQGC